MAPKQAQPPQPTPGRVIAATAAAAVFPGAGHLLLRRLPQAALLFLVTAVGLAAAVLHLARGLGPFETHVGTFLFPVLLRGLLVLHAFAVLDAYLTAVDTARVSSPRKRQAVLLNLLVPGTGYLLARAWVRAATGLALLALVLFFARTGRHPYLDLIYIGMQAIMAVAVYHQMQVRTSKELEQQGRMPQALPKVPAAQVLVLLVMTAAVAAFGYVLQQALPNRAVTGLQPADIETQTSEDGIRFAVPRLGLSMTAAGPGWNASSTAQGFLFTAAHERDANLRVGVQAIPPFVRTDRYLGRVRRWMEHNGLVFERSLDLKLGDRAAVQMRFSTPQHTRDHWTITVPVPGQKLAYLVLLDCPRKACQELLPRLERTRDSFRLK
jgi:hypothetical protein